MTDKPMFRPVPAQQAFNTADQQSNYANQLFSMPSLEPGESYSQAEVSCGKCGKHIGWQSVIYNPRGMSNASQQNIRCHECSKLDGTLPEAS